MDEGKKKLFVTYFGFLINDYNMAFKFQKFKEYKGFSGPIYCYSFYNKNGCLTFHHIAQLGEWGWYISAKFSCNQYELLQEEIVQTKYLAKNYLLTSSWVKDLSKILAEQAIKTNKIFTIKLN